MFRYYLVSIPEALGQSSKQTFKINVTLTMSINVDVVFFFKFQCRVDVDVDRHFRYVRHFRHFRHWMSIFFELWSIRLINQVTETKARPELQMIPLIRFYQVVKLLKEHNELRYHRLTNVLTSLAKVTFEDTFLVKVGLCNSDTLTIYFL